MTRVSAATIPALFALSLSFGALFDAEPAAAAILPGNDASGTEADLQIEHTFAEAPAGTVTITLAATNNGPLNGTGVTVSDTLSPHLAYVSDDCGGVNGAPWTWNIGSLTAGGSTACHLTASVVTPGTFWNFATIDGNEADTNTANNSVSDPTAVTGVGPSTPEAGFSLLRPFVDLTAPDETGASFSFRDHADKLLIVAMCTEWCTPCHNLSSQGAALQFFLAQAIGAENFLLVDILAQNQSGLASEQLDAQQWKASSSFPGPVLHAQGSNSSQLAETYVDFAVQYEQAGIPSFIPYIFILAPGCDNQVVARAPNQLLDEEQFIDTSSMTGLAALATQIWNERLCVKPEIHRLDRCRGLYFGNPPIVEATDTLDSVEAAEAFTVPPGEHFDIGAVTAAVSNASAIDFAIYTDSAGLPGSPVCSATALSASLVYGAPFVRRIELPSICQLEAGNYWLGLKGVGLTTDNIRWSGGKLALDEKEYAFRDALDLNGTGCTSWTAAGDCWGAGAVSTELCYILERPEGLLFADNLESGNTGAWSGTIPP